MTRRKVCKYVAIAATVGLLGLAGLSDRTTTSLAIIYPIVIVLTLTVVVSLWIGGYFHE